MSTGEHRHRGIGMTSARTRERLVERLRLEGISNLKVLERIRNVPRHLFVDEALASRAYEDTALPIGHGQTISQPFVVARMTESLLESGPVDKVLEIGTGCGYQTAVMAALVGTVYTIERIGPLLTRTRKLLRELGFTRARCAHGIVHIAILVRRIGCRHRHVMLDLADFVLGHLHLDRAELLVIPLEDDLELILTNDRAVVDAAIRHVDNVFSVGYRSRRGLGHRNGPGNHRER